MFWLMFIMSFPSNFVNSVKEEISDMSFVPNEGNVTVKEEPVFAFVPIEEDKNNKLPKYNTDLKSELHDEIKSDYVVHECVKKELDAQFYGNNLKESQQDPLAINYNDMQNFRREYTSIIDIKKENFMEKQEEYENIDLLEHKMESPVTDDNSIINIYEGRIPSSDSNERDTVSVRAQNIHSRIGNYECDECYQLFPTKHYIRNHIDRVHRRNKYACNESGNRFTTKEFIKMHNDIMFADSKTHEHYKCEKMFSDIGNLKTHSYKECNSKSFSCNDYSEICSSAHTLKLHDDSNYKGIKKNENKKYECKECHKLLSSRSLRTHINMVHKRIKYQCKECKGMFSKQYLKVHIDRVHKGIKKYDCGECHKFFAETTSLRAHIDSVHKGIKTYKCNECHKIFFQSGNLKLHFESKHRGIKYECDECHGMFCQLGSLKKHINGVHKKIKNYQCHLCLKLFSQKFELKKHINSVHMGIKKYECPECMKLFSHSGHLKQHIDGIHIGIKYECIQCGKLFSQRVRLVTHLKRVHKVIKDNECN